MIGFYNYTVYLTYASLISAMLGIHNAAQGRIGVAIICLMLSGFFDLFDGIVARTKKDRTTFEQRNGIQIDSLVDVVAFGVLPAVIGYNLGMSTWWGLVIICAYVLAGVIRLAYFNVLTEEPLSPDFKGFVGLPVTSAALVFPAVYLSKKLFKEEFCYVYAGIMVVLLVLFVSKIKIKKPAKKEIIIMLALGLLIGVLVIMSIIYKMMKNK